MHINRLSAFAAAVCVAVGALCQTLEQTAGIYYAYPIDAATAPSLTPAPEGYQPFYLSHYGRHGSRWITDDFRYLAVLQTFDSLFALDKLTPLGIDVRERLQVVTADALGRSGSLSPIGERQHRGIAERMMANFPEIFTDSAKVDAASSTSQRCILSMAAFTDRMRQQLPNIDITRHAHNKDMSYIAHATPEGKAFSSDTAFWRASYAEFCKQIVQPQRLMASLMVEPDSLLSEVSQRALMMGLYWIASDMQDVELDMDFYDIFTYDELCNLWRTINARMYLCNADAPLAGGVMKHCADNLLADIVERANAAIAGNGESASLRFGHDTHLLRLLALLGIAETLGQETDMDKMHEAWRDYELSPMAANLQLVFYRNADGDVIFKVLLNEHETAIPSLGDGPYYPWTGTIKAGVLPARR